MQIDEYRKMYLLEENFWWYRGMWQITKEILSNFFELSGDVRILDAGCGTGRMLMELGEFTRYPPFGFDFSEEAVRFLRIRGVPNVLQASTMDIPFQAESFDLVTSFDVLCQLPEDGDFQALREFHRVLKRHGKIYVRVPAYQWMFASHDRRSLTVRRYGRGELAAKVQAAGFQVLKTAHANFFLFPALAFKRLLLEKLGILADSSDLRPIPDVLNELLKIPLRLEARVLKSPSFGFPCGLSILCLAEKR